MFSNAPDSSSRAFVFSAVFWLVVGATSLAVGSIKLVSPDFLATRILTYSRLTAIGSMTLIYGWLTLSSLAAIFFIVPRITGARIRSEKMGLSAAFLINLTLVFQVALTLFIGVSGQQFNELEPYLAPGLILAGLLAAAAILRTISRRIEPKLYVSAWYFTGAVIWFPLAIVVGYLHSLHGVGASIAHLFSVNAILLLWLASTGIGTLYYVVPRASASALYSHRLGLIGFWSLALIAPLAGQARQLFGPAPDWLETIGIAASIALLITAITVLVNLFGTLQGAWSRVPDHPSIRFFVAGGIFFAAAMGWGAGQGLRSIAREAAATEWITGQVWVLLLGAFSAFSAGLISYALPRLMGHRWVSRSRMTASFWLAVLGSSSIGVGSIGAGIVWSAILVAANANQHPLASGLGYGVVLDGFQGFHLVLALGFVAFAVSAWLFGMSVAKSAAEGEPHQIEIVAPETYS